MNRYPLVRSIILGLACMLACAGVPEAKGQVIMRSDTVRGRGLFPLMRGFVEQAEAMGAEFPKPYGIAASMYYQRMNMSIQRVSLGDIVLDPSEGIIDFDGSEIQNTVISSQARADVWVLPFMNVYGMLGRVTTFNDIGLQINLNTDPIPGITPGDITLFERQEIANINGRVLGIGTVLAGGYQNFFANVNITWAKTYLEEVDSYQQSFVVFPMVGISSDFANFIAGAIYQDSGQVNKGSFTNSSGTTTRYEVEYDAKLWNFTVGLNKSIGNWSIVIFQGFGARTNSAIEVGYRFGA